VPCLLALQIGPKECPNLETLLHLWLHESMRVFHDRLIDVTDKAWFTALAVELIARYFGKSGAGWTVDDLCGKKPVLFVDFLRPSLDDGDSTGIYEEAHVMAKVVAVLDDALEDYNLSNPTQMRLVFFRDAVEHVSRIARILRQPRGNAMLVGVGGSGKQSLTRIACHLGGTECFSIELTRGYGVPEFREDLKKIMLRSGVGGKHVAFLLADTQITQEAFLEDVSNLLNTGEVRAHPAAEMPAPGAPARREHLSVSPLSLGAGARSLRV
jgi:dynein heavy chain, axonemal